jgi:glutathione S-transferase
MRASFRSAIVAEEAAMSITLVIGNKNYSSWSMRPWLVLAHHNIPFEEIVINLYADDKKQRILEFSPTGKVPVLKDGKQTIWETLAILEYFADKFPDLHLWPKDAQARAHARAVSNEMHAGFQALRQATPMNLKRVPRPIPLSDEVKADVARVEAIWNDCRMRYGKSGHFLFGDFSVADCMYAPVATRLRTYDVPVDLVASAYVDTIYGLPAFQRWQEAALKEVWTSHYDSV